MLDLGIHDRVQISARFNTKWEESCTISSHVTTKCWFWTACKFKNGYGKIGFMGEALYAHRVSYILYNIEIPEGLQVNHRCHNRSCVNPDHLYAGTVSQNNLDRCDVNLNSRGSGHHLSKLTEQQVLEIRTSADPGTVLALRYNVTPSTISYIKRGKTWKRASQDFNSGGVVHSQEELDRVRELIEREG